MNPNTHQMYLRHWVKLTGVPVFGVNYKKAPEHPFPSGLNDCWQVYNWLLNESHKHFKIIKNKKIILCGDSAGGNLIFSLVNLLIENNV
jgi:hormone-sensitive lipase